MKTNTIKVAKVLTVLGLMASGSASALDTLPMVPGDSSSVGKTSSAKLVGAGGVRAGIVIEGADIVKLNNEKKADSSYGSGHQAFVNFSYGLFKDLELDLSIKTTREIMYMNIRDGLYENKSRYDEGFKKFKETGYAGTRVMLKYRLIQNNGLNITIAPFAEEGMGERGMYSVTKTQKAAAGWLALLSYGHTGIGEINLNTGVRYQEPQRFDDRFVRNEVMARISVTGYFLNDFGVFSTVGGRRLMVASALERGPDSKLVYEGQDSGEILGGLVGNFGLTKVSVYGGADLNRASELGSAQHTYGFSIATKLGNKLRDHQWEAKVKRNKRRQVEDSKDKDVAEVSSPVSDPVNDAKAYPEMTGVVDPLSATGGPVDDFDRIRMKMSSQHATGKSGLSEEDELEAELAKLKAADAKAAYAKAKREKLNAQKQTATVKEKPRNNKKQVNEYRRKVREELDDEDSISTEDTNWKGLE